MLRLSLIALLIATLPAHAFPAKRCVNLSNHLETRNSKEFRYSYASEHIAMIAQAGFDTIRVPANVARHFDDGRIAHAFLAELQEVIDLALAADLFIILSLHNYDAIMADPDKEGERFVAIWRALAQLFDDIPDRIAFELLNEPTGAMMEARAQPLYDRALAEIRALQPERWVVIGGYDKNGVWGLKDRAKPNDPFIVHSFHFYHPFEFTHQGTKDPDGNRRPIGVEWEGKKDRDEMDQVFALATEHHTPVFMGEFGVFEDAPFAQRINYIRAVRENAEANDIGWCHWGFGAGFGVFEPSDNAWYSDILRALMR